MKNFDFKFLTIIIFLTCSIVLSLAFQSFAAGGLTGKVYDKETKEILPGANIIVDGTSIGAATDINGAFTIRNIPSGNQKVIVSYVGYNSITVNVDIPDNRLLEQNFYLQATAIEGKTVTVTAQALGQLQAINQQLSSNTIVNVVSAAKIQELPDFNAAEAIGRLPGIATLRSSGEANQVVIRGISPQYNLVSIDNITMASTQKNNRAVDLDMISSYMLQSIDVYKALTPDMDANAIGGIVNMQLREAPSGLHSDLMWQSGYTDKTKKYNNYKAVAAVSSRFFDDKLGLYLLLNAESYDRSADNMSAGYRRANNTIGANGFAPVQVTSMGLNRHFETRGRYGGNFILDYKLPHGSLRFINMLSQLKSDYTDYRTNYDYVGLGLNWNYQAGLAKTDVAINALQGKYDFGFMSLDLSVANSYSRNHNPHVGNYQFSQSTSINGPIPQDSPPENLFQRANFNSSQGQLDQLGYNTYDFKENDQVYSINLKAPFNFESSVSGYFKFGGKYRYNYRTNNENAPYIQLRYQGNKLPVYINQQYPNLRYDQNTQRLYMDSFTDYSTSTTDFLDNKFGTLLWVPNPYYANAAFNFVQDNYSTDNNWHNGAYENKINDYRNVERYYAAYGMAEIDLGPQLMIVGGARYEEDKMLFTAYRVKQQMLSSDAEALPQTKYPENHYWLPMVQAKYSFTDWGDIRYAYTKTLARPDYTQLAPYLNLDLSNQYVNMGNPDLKPAESVNHDLMLTIHNNYIGLFSIGAFYKSISNFSYGIQYPVHPYSTAPGYDTLAQVPGAIDGSILTTYYNNPYQAFIKGLEFAFETRLWYLPAPLNGLVISFNYTLIHSSTNYPLPLLRYIKVGRISKEIIVDSARAGRLINQPDNILNAAIGYDYEGFSARLSFLYQGSMVSGIGTVPEQDGVTHDYFRIDATVRQKLPWDGFQVFFNINNINSRADISAQQTIGGFTSEQFYGLTADLGIRYTL